MIREGERGRREKESDKICHVIFYVVEVNCSA